MRYEDASQTGAFQGQGPIANDDLEMVAAGSKSAATGNLISGEGTQSGPSGADSAAGAQITAIAGKSGEDSSFAGGKLSVTGEYGKLSVDAQGNYVYQVNQGVENVRDRFTYTLADNQGASDSAALIVEIGKTPVVIKANAQQIVPGPDGVVTLPAGVELSDVHVVGRNLVVDMPDGTQLIIIDGAVFVPQLVLGGVEVPATNVAALLIGQEPTPAAGETPPSSGGNFAVPPPPLDPGVPLGDLIPPTEYNYIPPEPEEVLDILDREPEIFIQPDGQPASVSAVDQVEEAGLPTRNGNLPGEPAGSGESADGNGADNDVTSETTAGDIIYNSPDGVDSITIDGLGLGGPVVITGVGQTIAGQYGTLTITSIAPGVIGYSYTLHDNTSGNATHDDFSVVLTDDDGDQASATLRIDIIDDVPTARNDTDASVNGVATGNVMTDAAPGDIGDTDTNAADTVGADNATLTAVSGTGGSDSTFSEGVLNVNGTFGSLVIDAQGNYTYTVNPNAGGGGVDVFTYTLTDGDGDTTTATLTITNPDLFPTLPDPALIRLDDDVVPGANGIVDGVGDDDPDVVGQNSVNGQLAGSGGDGDLDYAFTGTNTLPAGFTVNVVNASTVQIVQGGTVVLTITLNNETGAFTVVQNSPIDHPAGSDENNLSFGVGVQVVDVDGDVEPATITINVDDDTPTIGRADVTTPSLQVDESILANNASANFSVIFNGQYGADGPGTTSYALNVVNGTDSGLVDVATGLPVLLYNIGGVVTGSTSATLAGVTAGNTVFTVSVNSGTGVVTLDQIRALDHPANPNPNDPVSPNPTSIQLVATITDGDGDPASLSVNIGGQLTFLDDGPTVDVTLSGAAEPTLVTQDSETDGVPTSQDTASANFAASFTVNANGGADGIGSQNVTYVLGVSAPGVDSGLDQGGNPIFLHLIGGVVVGSTSASAAGVNAGNTVFNVSVDAGGTVTLTQFSQIDHPPGGDPSPSGTPFVDHLASLADSLVTLTATATVIDGDGDPASDSQSLNIGANLVFQDDGPDISAVLTGTLIRIDETDGVVAAGGEVDPPGGNLGTVTVAAASLFTVSNVNVSADTPTTLSYGLVLSSQGVASGLLLSTTNAPIFLYDLGGGVIAGSTSATLAGVNAGNTAFSVSINPGTGAVTMTQFLAVEHFNTSSHDEDSSGLTAGVLGVQVTATDFDGDTDQATVDLGSVMRFEDDGPSIDVSVSTQFPEPNLLTQDAETDGVPTSQDSASSSANFGGVFLLSSNGGSDGAASSPVLGYTLGVQSQGVDSGLDQGGNTIFLYLIGGVVVGSTSATAAGVNTANTVFDVTVSGTGVVTLTQFSQIDHPPAGDPTGTGAPFADHILSMADGLVTLTASSTITDNDGDTATDSATINIGANLQFADDGPDVAAVLTGTLLKLDETDGVGVPGEVDPLGGNLGTITVAVATLVNVTQPNVSADTPTTLAYSLALSAPGVDSGLDVSSNNASIFLYNIGGQIVGSTAASAAGVNAGNTAFTVSINPTTGAVTITQFLAIEHANTANHDEDSSAIALGALNLVVTATDFDGDTDVASVDLGSVIRFEDDGPTAENDVDVIIGGNGPATGNVLTGVEVGVPDDANNQDGVADNVGSDTPGTVTFIASNNVPANTDGIYTAGNLVVNGQYGTLTINANGDYSYLRTSGPGGVQDVFTYTLTDADGDTVTATLTISIDDNFPSLPDPALVRLDDDVIPGANGNVDGPSDDDPDTVGQNVVNGNLVGSGGDGDLDYFFTGLNTLPAGFSVNAAGLPGSIQILQGATVVMTVTLNNETGAFTVTQNAPILHPADNGGPEDNIENNLNFSIGVEVRDEDGDVEPAAITINVDDDTPTINVTKGADAAVILTTDDAQTIGVASDTAVSAASFGGVFGLVQSAGADGAAVAATLSYALDVTGFTGGPAGVNSGLESHDVDIFLYEIGGKVVGSTSATLAGVNGGNTVFDVGVNGSGVVTLTQYQQIDHDTVDPTPGGSPFADHIVSMTDGLITLTASASLTDNDGDNVTDSETVDIGANLRFTDDGPDAATSGTAVGTVTLDESRPEGTDTAGGGLPNGDASATIDFSVNFVSGGSVNYGADGPGSVSYALALTGANVNSGLFALDSTDTETVIDGYGQGAQIVLNISGNTVTGSVGATNYFTLTIDPATGVVTFTQLLPIWHPTPGTASFDEAATLTTLTANLLRVVQTVTDFDGDTDTASINIGQGVFAIQDDGPQAIQPDPASLENEAGATVTEDLDDDGEVITDFGEDGPGLVRFANITNGQDSTLDSGGTNITYWLSNNGQTLQGRTNSTNGTDGQLIFTVQINQASGDYTVSMTGTVDNGAGVTFSNLTSTKAGNVDVRGVGADDPLTAVDLLLTASANGANSTINTDSDSIGSDNQSLDDGETVRIDFVTNLETNAGLPSGFSYDGHVGTNSLLQAIPQVQGNQNETVAFRVYALNTTVTDAALPDDTPGNGFSDSTIVNTVTHVTIDGFDVGETAVTVALGAVGVWTTIAYGVSAQRQADGSVIFTGVQQGDQYGITTSTDFNAFAVTALPAGVGPNAANDSSTNSFDLGVFSIGQVDTGDPINISFDLSITDADGDTIVMPGAMDITLTPDVDAQESLNFRSAAAEESSSSMLVADSHDSQKVAANSNSVTMATAVAAAGIAESQAAASEPASSEPQVSEPLVANAYSIEKASVDGEDGGSSAAAQPEVQDAAAAPASSGRGSGNGNANGHDNQFDSGSNGQASDSGSKQAANDDQGPATAEPQVALAPDVAMVSAEALLAAGLEGGGKKNGSVEKIVAEVIDSGQANVDGLLNAIHGGNGDGPAIAILASPAAAGVSTWDMASNGGSSANNEMLMKVGAETLHHDMVQPTQNG